MQFPTTALRAAFCSIVLLVLSLLAVPSAQAATTGEQKTAVILVNFSDQPTQPLSRDAAHALVFGSVSDFYWEASYQKTFLSGNTFGWFTIPVSRTVCNVPLLKQEADKAATAAGVNLAAYDRLIYLAPQNSCTATGYNDGPVSPSRTTIITDSFNVHVIAHELGHNFGLSHSQALDCGASVLGTSCLQHGYGDAADIMGSGETTHFNAFQKEGLGWLNASGQPPITTVAASGTYAIAPIETAGTSAKALKIARGVDAQTGQMSYYYVEYRQALGFDAELGSVGNLANGVLVHTGGVNQSSMLLDMTPDSDPTSAFRDIRDGALTVGRVYTDSAAGISIKLVAADANAATVQVTLGATPTPSCLRAAPALSLTGPTAAVAAGSSVSYTMTVTNKDSGACEATTFGLARSVPAGWAGTLAASALSLSPGASGSTTLTVTSPSNAAAGSYGVGAGTTSTAGSVHTASASATYAVAAPGTSTLTGSAGTDKASYARGETVYMSALVKNNGTAVSGASVKFTVTLPNGAKTAVTALSGSDGYARGTYKTGKTKTALGSYALRADASYGGGTATGTSSFSVR